MIIGWLLAMAAQAGPLCDVLLVPTPPVASVGAALANGDDPNELCRWVGRVPMSHTVGGFLAAVLLPVISWPVVFTEDVNKKQTALPLVLAMERLGDDGVELLLDAGARPYAGILDQAIAQDRWELARRLVAAGTPPFVEGLEAPLAGDLGRLGKLETLGIRLEHVSVISDGGKLLTDPVVAARFLDRGLPAEVLLVPVADGGTLAVLDLCLSRVNPIDDRVAAALREAAVGGRWDVVERLRAIGVPWETTGQEPVLIAVVSAGSARDTDRVLRGGADPAARDPFGQTALHVAVENGRADLVTRLVDAGAPLDDTGAWGRTPLAIAAGAGRADLVQLLLARGASPSAGNPLAAALDEGQVAIAGLLVDAGAQVDDDTVRRLVGNRDALRYLLGHGLSADRRLGTGETLPVLAIRSGSPELLRLLVDAGAPLDGDTAKSSAFRAAIATDDPARVEQVLALGADPTRIPTEHLWDGIDGRMEALLLDRLGLRPPPEALVDAAREGDAARVAMLLAHGADPNAANRWGDVPFARTLNPEVERLLLAAGAEVPLALVDEAVRDRRWPQLERLGVRGRRLDPLLAVAVARRDTKGLDWLLAHGASIHAVDREGWTVLHHAVTEAPELIGRLIAAGAVRDARDPSGRTAMDLALERGEDEAVETLLAAGAPYAPAVLRYDLATCRTARLQAHVSPETLSWTEIRPVVRAAGCGPEIRRWLRGTP